MYQQYLADIFIFHNVPLHCNLSMGKINNFLQAMGRIRDNKETGTYCTCLHSLGLLGLSPLGPAKSYITTFSVPSGALSPVLADSRLYYHGSNWQGCKPQPMRSTAFPAACGCVWVCSCRLQWLVIIKTVIWGSWCPLHGGCINYSFQWSLSESARDLQMAFPNGRRPFLVFSVRLLQEWAGNINVPPHLHLQ